MSSGVLRAGTAGVLTVVCAGLLGGGVTLPAHAADSAGHVGWWYDALKVERAHASATGSGVTVAVIDGSIDPAAPELRGADVELRTDCRGDRVRPRSGSVDDHGTSMTALIVGTGKGSAAGGAGVRGIAPDAKVLYYSADPEPSEPGAPVDLECDGYQTAEVVRDAVGRGADVITMSISGFGGATFEQALQEARDQGVVVVASAGDATKSDLGVSFPASIPGVVAVNAVDRSAKPWVSNPAAAPLPNFPVEKIHQAYPVISAPGVDLKTLRWRNGSWRSEVTSTGTSPAAALVAGALALVKQKYPEATGNQLIQNLIHFTGGSRTYSWDRQYGFGIVALNEMLDHDPAGWPDENPLLKGPSAALADYPMSAYRDVADRAEQGEEGTAPRSPVAADPDRDRSGVPGWLWVPGGLAAVLAAGAAVFTSTRRRRSAAPTLTKSEV